MIAIVPRTRASVSLRGPEFCVLSVLFLQTSSLTRTLGASSGVVLDVRQLSVRPREGCLSNARIRELSSRTYALRGHNVATKGRNGSMRPHYAPALRESELT